MDAHPSGLSVYKNGEKTRVMVGWAFGGLGQLRATVYFLNSLNLSSQYAMVSKTLKNFVRGVRKEAVFIKKYAIQQIKPY